MDAKYKIGGATKATNLLYATTIEALLRYYPITHQTNLP